MRSYLTNQMIQKKIQEENEKKFEAEQLKMWNDENQKYFDNEKEKCNKVKIVNKQNAEFLKSQFRDKKKESSKMNEEEYRLNKDILEDIYYTPKVSKKNFLI